MIEVTSQVTGDADDVDIQLIGFRPAAAAGEWVAVVTGTIKEDGNILSVTKEFGNVPAAVESWLNNTGLPLAKTGLKGAL
jgi:hypothetical protein